jgi:ubiquinone/menaquinone biosynthesis C-methylase UbiE
MKGKDYVHGYSEIESGRLEDQANCLARLLHHDTIFPKGSLVLEAGCGVGAQTKIIAKNNPNVRFISIDVCKESLAQAEKTVKSSGIRNVKFQAGDVFNLNFDDETFDHIFVCFVLEHLKEPVAALKSLKRVLKKGGSITVIEGDHGSAYFYPRSKEALQAIDALVKLQSLSGGNALIGREVYPLLNQAGFKKCSVSPRMVYVDSSRPDLAEGFIKNTFTAMIEGIRETAVKKRIIKKNVLDKGINDLYRTMAADGVFCYTFFKGIGYK